MAATFFIGAFAYILLCPFSASALSLPSVSLDLPLNDTPLAPVTKQLDGVTSKLPVSVGLKSTSNTVGADLDTGSVPVKAKLSVAVPNAVPKVVSATTKPLSSVTQPVANTTRPLTQQLSRALPALSNPVNQVISSLPPARQAHSNGQPTKPDESSAGSSASDSTNSTSTAYEQSKPSSKSKTTTQESHPFFSNVATFFGSTLPGVIRNLANNIAGKEVKTFPIVVSLMIFLATLIAVGGIVYASNRGGLLTVSRIGRINLAKFAEAHDLAQIGAFVVVTVCFGLVAIFLTLTGL